MDVSYKNMDSKSRTLFDGDILINYNGTKYTFDKSETILLRGWGILLKKINPLTTFNTKLVYKIPLELKGDLYYKPKGAKKTLILLGAI